MVAVGLHRTERPVTNPKTARRLLPGRVRLGIEHVILWGFYFIFQFREREESEEAHAHGPYGRDCRRHEGAGAYAQKILGLGSDVAR